LAFLRPEVLVPPPHVEEYVKEIARQVQVVVGQGECRLGNGQDAFDLGFDEAAKRGQRTFSLESNKR
jgi:hypothetical protein